MTALALPVHTERLTLRAHRPDGLEPLLEVYGDPWQQGEWNDTFIYALLVASEWSA